MIAPEIIDRVKRLLATNKHSQREIAKMTGVSRGTIGLIVSGKRLDIKPVKKRGPYEGTIGRCPTCGAMVSLPCRVCEFHAKGNTVNELELDPENEPVGIELVGEERKRYDEVHFARLVQEEISEEIENEYDDLPEFYYTAIAKREWETTKTTTQRDASVLPKRSCNDLLR